MKVIELFENFRIMQPLSVERLRVIVAREVRNLRERYMDTHLIPSKDKGKEPKRMTLEEFGDHCGLTWKTIENIENEVYSTGVETLHQIVTACESNLAEFFSVVVTRAELEVINQTADQEFEIIQTIVKALSNSRTQAQVRTFAKNMSELLQLLEAR